MFISAVIKADIIFFNSLLYFGTSESLSLTCDYNQRLIRALVLRYVCSAMSNSFQPYGL